MLQYVRNTMGIKEKNDLENAQMELKKVNETSEIAFIVMVENGSIDEVTAAEHQDVFSPWVVGVAYQKGSFRTYGDGNEQKLYKCIQPHTSQVDWTPNVAVSLWVVAGDPAIEFPNWSQPIGAHDAYQKGAKVTYNGQHWISTADNNVWAPNVYGWDATE